jgi:hypothetical protein
MSELPTGAYLRTRYSDSRRNLDLRTTYYDDGRVELIDAEGTMLICTFTPQQVAQAKDAVRAGGLLAAQDMDSGGVNDSAGFSMDWALDGRSGTVANAAYPARKHPAMEAVLATLDALEEEAKPLSA